MNSMFITNIDTLPLRNFTFSLHKTCTDTLETIEIKDYQCIKFQRPIDLMDLIELKYSVILNDPRTL